jgi:hypothetical protein
MRQLPIEQQILLVVEISALAILCLRMCLAGLHRVYVYFFGFLVLNLLQALIPMLVPLESRLYRDLYVASEPLIVAFSALVVLELYSKVLRDLPGIASTARRYIKATLALAIGIALLPLGVETTKATLTGYLNSFERTVMSSLVVFVLLVSAFLVYYPVPLGRNVVVYLMGYAVFFLTNAATTLMINLGHHWIRQLSSLVMGVEVVCFIFWFIALSRQGETKHVVVGHQWNPADEQQLRARLDAINASLLRARGNSTHGQNS